MTPEGWATNLGAILAAGYAGWQSYQAKKAARAGEGQARQANVQATVAADRSEPTSNGYATSTKESLSRIERQGQRTEDLLREHINDHARAGLGAVRTPSRRSD